MNLIGIHDREAVNFTPADTWILDTIALSENPAPTHYESKFHWITRVNWGYGSTGTLPIGTDRQIFYDRLAHYVANSKNCHRWTIGNEPNLSREWPNNQPIYPVTYAEVFKMARKIIKSLPGHGQDEVLIAGPGPWNNELKYAGNERGDWVRYFLDQMQLLSGEFDGFTIHAYTHGYNTDLVWSEAVMNHPFEDRYYEFFTYKDFIFAIPDAWAQLPIYLTEANGNGPWKAVGLMKAMAQEIAAHNQRSPKRKIKSLIFFRYPNFGDGYHIQGKEDVMREYINTVNMGHKTPVYLPVVISPVPPLKVILYPNTPQTTVKASVLNVRDKPGTVGTKIVGTLAQGQKISVLEERAIDGSGWYRIGPDQWVIAEWTDKPIRMDKWQAVRDFTLSWEGEFQNLHWDIGNWTGCQIGVGENKGTKYGISACSYPNLDIENLTQPQAEKIFFEDFWIRSGASELEWPLCLIVFDTAVNFGAATAAIWLQQSRGNALTFVGLRLKGYRRSQSWPQAGNAWIDRTADLLLEAGE